MITTKIALPVKKDVCSSKESIFAMVVACYCLLPNVNGVKKYEKLVLEPARVCVENIITSRSHDIFLERLFPISSVLFVLKWFEDEINNQKRHGKFQHFDVKSASSITQEVFERARDRILERKDFRDWYANLFIRVFPPKPSHRPQQFMIPEPIIVPKIVVPAKQELPVSIPDIEIPVEISSKDVEIPVDTRPKGVTLEVETATIIKDESTTLLKDTKSVKIPIETNQEVEIPIETNQEVEIPIETNTNLKIMNVLDESEQKVEIPTDLIEDLIYGKISPCPEGGGKKVVIPEVENIEPDINLKKNLGIKLPEVITVNTVQISPRLNEIRESIMKIQLEKENFVKLPDINYRHKNKKNKKKSNKNNKNCNKVDENSNKNNKNCNKVDENSNKNNKNCNKVDENSNKNNKNCSKVDENLNVIKDSNRVNKDSKKISQNGVLETENSGKRIFGFREVENYRKTISSKKPDVMLEFEYMEISKNKENFQNNFKIGDNFEYFVPAKLKINKKVSFSNKIQEYIITEPNLNSKEELHSNKNDYIYFDSGEPAELINGIWVEKLEETYFDTGEPAKLINGLWVSQNPPTYEQIETAIFDTGEIVQKFEGKWIEVSKKRLSENDISFFIKEIEKLFLPPNTLNCSVEHLNCINSYLAGALEGSQTILAV